MSETSKRAREAMKAKAHRLAHGDPHEKVDASSWEPPEMLGTTAKTGMRPLSPRQFKDGGKVHGEHHRHAGRKARKGGGRAIADAIVNRDLKEANEERAGEKHVGGFKRGGRAHKDMGGGLGGMGGLLGIIPQAIIGATGHRGDRDSDDGSPTGGASLALPRKKGGRAHKDMGGPLSGALSQGMGGQGRMNFNYRPGGQGMVGLKRGGKAEHADEAEDKKLIARELHAKGCRCAKCMGGRMKKGGSVSDGEYEGTRPTGGRLARKDGGGEKWIAGAVKHPGALHRELGVPEGKKIPAKKLEKAEHSKNPKLAKRAHLAETLKGMHHKDGGRAHEEGMKRAIDESAWGRGEKREERKHGGRAGKGKVNVNVIVAPHAEPQAPPQMGQPPMPPPRPPGGVPVPMPGAPAPGGAPMPMPYPMPVGGGGIGLGGGGGQPMMPRKRGGRAFNAGAGSGEGRLEKTRAYGDEARRREPGSY